MSFLTDYSSQSHDIADKNRILAEHEISCPLSACQQSFWFLYQLQPEIQGSYNQSFCVRVNGEFKVQHLRDALELLINRHPMLRVSFYQDAEGQLLQHVQANVDTPLQIVDVANLSESAVSNLINDTARQALPLTAAPMFRASVFKQSDQQSILLLVFDHLICDGWSFWRLIEELGEILTSNQVELLAGEHHKVPSYFAYARWQKQWLQSDIGKKQLAYWQKALADHYPALNLLSDNNPQSNLQAGKQTVRLTLPTALSHEIRQLTTKHRGTLFITLLSAYFVLLNRLTNQQRIAVGSLMPSRGNGNWDQTVGCFVNTVALRLELDEALTVTDLIQHVRKISVNAMLNQDYPLAELVEQLNPERNGDREAFFQTLFVFQNSRGANETLGLMAANDCKNVQWGNMSLSPYARSNSHGGGNFDLVMEVAELSENIVCALEFDTAKFSEATVERYLRYWQNILIAMLADDTQKVANIPMMETAESDMILRSYNATEALYPAKCLHKQFEAQVERTPQALAVQQADHRLSYAELNSQANQLAHYLLELGVQPDDRIVLCLERSPELIIAIMAVLKAGGCYVPLDPAYPEARLASIVQESQPVIVLCAETLKPLFQQIAPTLPIVSLRADAMLWQHQAETNPQANASGLSTANLAYVIYTSGSTGQPKGVMIEHDSLSNGIHALKTHYSYSDQDRVLQFASITFDVAAEEIFSTLLSGASLILRSDAWLTDAQQFWSLCAEQQISIVNIPTLFWQQLVQEHAAIPQTVRHIIIGGDAVTASALAAWQQHQGYKPTLSNAYGPTETTINATIQTIDAQQTSALSIGQPIANTRIYILDTHGQPVPVGVAGEIYIAGAGVARGYLGQPELTAAKFSADPFINTPNARMYRSGDLGRWLNDGSIEFLGRNDFQVKIRGFRIELGEIETRLSSHPAIREAVVLARTEQSGEKSLVAYYTGEQAIDIADLRHYLQDGLPDYMVPSAYVCLASWPLTSNGKLDRAALPAPTETAYARNEYQAPQGQIETQLAAIWAELLSLEQVGRQDHFFELGGHSLLAVTLIERMRRAGLHTDVRALFATPTLAGLAAVVTSESREVTVPENKIPPDCMAITPDMLPLINLTQAEIDGILAQVPGGAGNVQDMYPLAPTQEGILFHHMLNEQGDAYLLHNMLSFNEKAKLDAFLQALQMVINRHDVLRTAIYWQELPEPIQVVWRQAPLQITEVSLDDDQGDLAEQLRNRFDSRLFRLNLQQAPLMQAFISFDAKQQRWLLLLLDHHIVTDHTSQEILLEEVHACLNQQAGQLPRPLPYRNFVGQARLNNSVDHVAFFQSMLGDIDEPTAAFGLLDVQQNGRDIAESHLNLSADLANAIRSTAQKLAVSPASIFHLAWAQVLSRMSGREDVVFGSVVFGRMQAGAGSDRVLGMFNNTLPVRITVADERVQDALLATHRLLTELMRHEHASLALAQRCSGVALWQPLFTSLFNYRYTTSDTEVAKLINAEGWPGIELLDSGERSNYPLALDIDDQGDGFALTAQAHYSIGAQRVCDYMQTALNHLLIALEHAPGTAVRAVDVLPEWEKQQLIWTWNATQMVVPTELCVHELFELQVQKTPQAVAIEYENQQLRFSELNKQANRLAHYLRELGVGPDSLVGICMPRGLNMIVSMFAILKAGGAYLPLDPAYPEQRLNYLLTDATPIVVLTENIADLPVSGLAQPPIIIDLLADAAHWAALPDGNLSAAEIGLTDQHLAYVIYTSGSTGQPKGVMIEHRNLINQAQALKAKYQLTVKDCVLQFAAITFDMSVEEIFGALLSGASLLIRSDAWLTSAEEFWALCETNYVTVANLPTLFWQHLLKDQAEIPETLRQIMIGGDAVTAGALNLWFSSAGYKPTLFNAYGPTEATVNAAIQEISANSLNWQCIGQPIANTRIYILDTHGQPVPVGVSGEIYIAGAGVARGYLGQPELTAAKFSADPFVNTPNARMYRSGDLGRWLNDGSIEFLGRNDFQVKIRGFRIELGEIETRLSSHPAIREAVVLARTEQSGEKSLVAYYTGEQTIEIAELRHYLQDGLPDYMVPSAYVCLASWPLTSNGKLDRAALPAPTETAYARTEYQAPQGQIETQLAAIWAELLGLEQVGRQDHFFELGGHSLIAVTLIEKMRRAGLHTDVRALFATPTLAGLAAAVTSESMEVAVPENKIPPDCTAITPDMLPLITLTQAEIDGILAQVPGGAGNVQDMYPLAPLQAGMLFHHLLNQTGDVYLEQARLAFVSKAKLDEFLTALQAVINRHDILRTAIYWQGLPEPVQVVWREAQLPVSEFNFSEAQGDIATQLQDHFDTSRFCLNLQEAPLMQAGIAYDARQQRWLLVISHHHIAVDHASLDIMLDEICLYLQNDTKQLPKALPFRNYVALAKMTSDTAKHEAFFQDLLGDIDQPTAPYGLLNTQAEHAEINEARQLVDAGLALQLKHQAKILGVSVASLCHVAWSLVLSAVSGQNNVVFGTVLFGRTQAGSGSEQVLGMFINTLPVRLSTGQINALQSVQQMHNLLSELLHHEHASLALAQRCSKVQAPTPLFTALLNYRHSQVAYEMSDKHASELWDGVEILPGTELSNYPLSLDIDDYGDAFRLTVQVQQPIAAQHILDYMHTALQNLLIALSLNPNTGLHDINVLSGEQRQQVLSTFNNTKTTYPAECLHKQFEAQVERTPHALAVQQADHRLSYAELNRQANQLAHYLLELGVQPDDRIVLCLERSPELIIAILAVLKAGGAYVPLDPAYPEARQASIVQESLPVVVICAETLKPLFQQIAPTLPIVSLYADATLWQHQAETNPQTSASVLSPANLAYVIYTSGSTGQPKGVMIEHDSLSSGIHALKTHYGYNDQDRVLQFASITFDVAAEEIFSTLLSGASLILRSDAWLTDAQQFWSLCAEQQISIVNIPTLFWQQLLQEHAAIPQTVRHIIIGGDAVSASALMAWQQYQGYKPTLSNAYGPTETTINATIQTINAQQASALSIGQPIANTRIYILDTHGQPVPVGVAGEIYIAGAGVARGYLGQPELTAAKFSADPFVNTPNARMYRSGDLGRWLNDGSIEFLGRNDFQVKIRGFRIELGEIETRLSSHPAIREAVVLARTEQSGEKSLVAYYTGEQAIDIADLRHYLQDGLPDYMVPSAYVCLASWPLTSNGKLDRAALPAPTETAYARNEYQAPQGQIETQLAAIWAELLGLEQVGRQDHFFELGGHSLIAVTLIEKMRRAGLHTDVRALFATPTLAGLAAAVTSESREVTVPENKIPPDCMAITPDMLPLINLTQTEIDGILAQVPGGAGNVQDMYPLAPLQAGMLFHHLLNQTGDVYLEQARLAFVSKAKLDEFLAALQAVINRHDILRTAIYWQGLPEPVQVVWREAQLPVSEFNFSEAQGDITTQLQDHFDTSRFRLNLQQAPLMQAGIAYDASRQRWQLIMVNHHLAVDHTAMEILLAEIQTHLEGQFSDLPAALPYRNYVAQALLANNDAAHENYFKNLLADVDETCAPLGLTDTQLNGDELTEVRLELENSVAASLRETARHLGVSAASICHVAWARALASLSGRDDVVFGTVLFGRMQAGAGADRVLGMFINTLPVRLQLRELACSDSVLQMHQQLNELLEHEHAPLSLAQSCSDLVAPAPLFTALLNYRYSIIEPQAENTDDVWQGIEMFDTAEQTNYPCVLSVDDLGAGFRLTAQVVGAGNAERVLAAMYRSLTGLVTALANNQQLTVMAIDVVSAQEKQQVLYAWNNTASDYPQHESIAEQFARQVQLSPDALAVIHNEKTWTYAELDRQANSLAKQLYSIGVGRTTNVVAILLERSFDLVVAQLAVLKCGAAYLPLDLSMPDERLQFVINDSGAPVVITASKLELPGIIDLLRIDLDTDSLIEDSVFDFDNQSNGDSTAYIMYTSGSTGQPKGVKIAHRGISRLVKNNGYLPFSADDRVAFAANPAFDASTMEVWGPLLNGGSLVVIDKAAFLQPQQFAQVLIEQQITALFITSALFNQYANTIPEALAQVKYLLTGGERGDVSSFAKVLQAGGHNHLIHCYGPTETTTFAITHRVSEIPDGAKSIPLGKPIANTSIYILDSVGQPVPVGVMGEIYIGGAGVALGYLDRPELTAERFLTDPYAPERNALMYKTGDLAYWRTDGCIEFVGRNDFQVKIRGFRIELGEIEARLAAHPELTEVLVMAREDQPGEKRLVVYYSGAETVNAEVLRQWLSDSLPDYMIPAAYVKLAALPVNANGKVDRKALPAPDGHAFAQRSYEAPQGEVEQQLAGLWQDLLKMEQIGRLDNFFEMGGHSLLAVQLMLRIQQDFSVELSLQDVFLKPVLQELAECIVDKQLAEFDLDDLTELAALLNETDSEIAAGE